ncbi:MAG: hypothetical protein K2Q24_05220 [Chitinophagaceae bacterium]|jgi:hypothetical protein|nr:hypothetical protein [Chitinophagaceae bacterium]
MQSTANVSLSAFEKELVRNPEWILTKNKIIEKVYVLFGHLSEVYKQHHASVQLPLAVTAASPKISKGENYKGLPYVMLDYPRCFSKEDVFAVRTFFWWGHFFSITLHLKGIYLKQYQSAIQHAINNKQLSNAWLNVSDDEWEHHFEQTHMKSAEVTTIAADAGIIKLAYKIELDKWEEAELFLCNAFDELMQTITI